MLGEHRAALYLVLVLLPMLGCHGGESSAMSSPVSSKTETSDITYTPGTTLARTPAKVTSLPRSPERSTEVIFLRLSSAPPSLSPSSTYAVSSSIDYESTLYSSLVLSHTSSVEYVPTETQQSPTVIRYTFSTPLTRFLTGTPTPLVSPGVSTSSVQTRVTPVETVAPSSTVQRATSSKAVTVVTSRLVQSSIARETPRASKTVAPSLTAPSSKTTLPVTTSISATSIPAGETAATSSAEESVATSTGAATAEQSVATSTGATAEQSVATSTGAATAEQSVATFTGAATAEQTSTGAATAEPTPAVATSVAAVVATSQTSSTPYPKIQSSTATSSLATSTTRISASSASVQASPLSASKPSSTSGPSQHPTTATISPSPTPNNSDTGGGDDDVLDTIEAFFEEDVMIGRMEVLIAFILSPVVIILCIVLSCMGCCWLRSCRRRNKRSIDLASSQLPTTRNGVSRPRSRASLHEMRHLDTDAFYGEYHSQVAASQPYYHTVATSDAHLYDPLPSISPLSYPILSRNYLSSPERRDQTSSPVPRISLSGSPSKIRRFPGSSPSLHRPTPLGQQLQRQAERNSGSRASISATGSRNSVTGSRNSFLSGSNTMSRDEMRSSGGFMASSKTVSEGETSSQLSYRPLMRQTSLDMVPTRESPVQLLPKMKPNNREYKSLTCISNPLALQGEKKEEEAAGREEGDGEDENDLRTDPLVLLMTSTPENNKGAEDLPTKEAKTATAAVEGSGDSSPRKKSLRQLTSLTISEAEEREALANTAGRNGTLSGVTGGEETALRESLTQKDGKLRTKQMSRLEKLTSLDYIRSSIRRSLKKKRVSFLTRTPDSTPKTKKKTPPRSLPTEEPEVEPDLTFTNQEAFDAEGPMISPRIHTPSPLSPEFETIDEVPQRYRGEDFYNLDVYPETLHHPYPKRGSGGRGGGVGGGGGRPRAYTTSDIPMYALQLSQPTYYPSSMHYPQPSYPQLSQQYIPAPYPLFGSPPQRGAAFGSPPGTGAMFGSPPQHDAIFGSPPQQSAMFGSPPQQGAVFGSPPSRGGFGPLTAPPLQQPSLYPGVHEAYGRRYTDSGIMGSSSGGPPHSGRGRGGGGGRGTEQASAEHHRLNYTKTHDAYTDTASNVSSRYDRGRLSPDRLTETSNISDIRAHSPDIYSGLGHDGYMEPQFRFRSIPMSPEDSTFSPQHYPMHGGGGGGGMGDVYGGERPPHRTAPHYTERSMENSQVGSGSYRQASGHGSQVPSPIHQPYHPHHHPHHHHGGQYRRTSLDRSPNDTTPTHRVRRGSNENQPPPPVASHVRRGSIDNQQTSGNNSRHNSIDGPIAGSHRRRTSIEGHPGMPGFQTILEPRPHRNGTEAEETRWQHSHRDDKSVQQPGTESRHVRMVLPVHRDEGDLTRRRGSVERDVDSGAAAVAKTKVSWNNEIIEHVRTPSDSSEHYDNL